ncbi:unnamed protein product, partial [Leptidea sinapis]
LKKYCINKINK